MVQCVIVKPLTLDTCNYITEIYIGKQQGLLYKNIYTLGSGIEGGGIVRGWKNSEKIIVGGCWVLEDPTAQVIQTVTRRIEHRL